MKSDLCPKRAVALGILLWPLLGSFFAAAQDAPQPRVTYPEGSVSIQPGGTGDWAAVDAHRELQPSDNLWADKDSRAELRIQPAVVDLGPETSLTLESFTPDQVGLRLWLGEMVVHLDGALNSTALVHTPNVTLTLYDPGEYRIDVNGPGDESVVTIHSGRAEAVTGSTRFPLIAGVRHKLTGSDHIELQSENIVAPDDFDLWASNRHDDSGSEPGSDDAPQATTAEVQAGPVSAPYCDNPWCEWDDQPEFAETVITGVVIDNPPATVIINSGAGGTAPAPPPARSVPKPPRPKPPFAVPRRPLQRSTPETAAAHSLPGSEDRTAAVPALKQQAAPEHGSPPAVERPRPATVEHSRPAAVERPSSAPVEPPHAPATHPAPQPSSSSSNQSSSHPDKH